MTKEQFIGILENWNSHRAVLWPALEATAGHVIEFGIGPGSTKALDEYCRDTGRMLFSYENNKEWFDKFVGMHSSYHYINFVQDWDDAVRKHREPVGVAFIDHAPGERRKYDIALFCNVAQIVVVHDSEPEATGYGLDLIAPLFKYRKDFEEFPAHATAFSNFINVGEWSL
jgi:hypothetical protein